MYCVKCGVHLSDSEKICPLCRTTVLYHPEMETSDGENTYPPNRYGIEHIRPTGWLLVATVLAFLPQMISVFCDLQLNDEITWSGYVVGALILTYTVCVFPCWFRNPNPVIFVPVGFVVTGLYLLYISLFTGGGWFLSFAFPLVGASGLITTTVVALVKYLKKGHLYIFGGGLIAAGGFMLLLEFLLHAAFQRPIRFWSLFPFSVLAFLGLGLIFIGICRPVREVLARKFFF